VAVVSADGSLIAHSGDIDRPFFLRSAAKPFQAAIAQESGAGLQPVELALAAASHDGEPVHVAIVEMMLSAAGLSTANLRCPPSWPLSAEAIGRLRASGARGPRQVWHSCSGKHAGWLRACAARGWPLTGYLSPDHPVQALIADYVTELGGHPVAPVGVDGCGAPTLRTTTRVMALLYARLATIPELRSVYRVMHRYPALVSGTGNCDSQVAVALNVVAKRGAAGCIGLAVEGRLGIAVKAWDGTESVAGAALMATLDALGELSPLVAGRLEPFARPPVLGGGEKVGELEMSLGLKWS